MLSGSETDKNQAYWEMFGSFPEYSPIEETHDDVPYLLLPDGKEVYRDEIKGNLEDHLKPYLSDDIVVVSAGMGVRSVYDIHGILKDCGLKTVLLNGPKPDRRRFLNGESDLSPAPYIEQEIKAASKLGIKHLLVSCFTANALYDDFTERLGEANSKVYNILDIAFDMVEGKGGGLWLGTPELAEEIRKRDCPEGLKLPSDQDQEEFGRLIRTIQSGENERLDEFGRLVNGKGRVYLCCTDFETIINTCKENGIEFEGVEFLNPLKEVGERIYREIYSV